MLGDAVTSKPDENPAMDEAPVGPIEMPEPEPEAGVQPGSAPVRLRHRRHGALALFLGGVAAAGIGAAATVYLLPQLPARWQPAAAMLAASNAEQSERYSALQAELVALRAATPQAPDLGPLAAAIAALDARVAALEAQPALATPDNAAAIDALRAELATIRAELTQSPGGAQTTSAEIAAAAAQASARIVAAETEAAAVRAAAEADAAKLRSEAEAAAVAQFARAGVARLAAAVEAGAPLTPALAELRAAGVTVPAELGQEVPTLSALRDGFAPAARAALAAARADAPGEGLLDRLGGFLLAQTGARSLAPREGADADAVLSRAEAALNRGELAATLAEIATLPEGARAEMAVWTAEAERREAATRALADLAQSLN